MRQKWEIFPPLLFHCFDTNRRELQWRQPRPRWRLLWPATTTTPCRSAAPSPAPAPQSPPPCVCRLQERPHQQAELQQPGPSTQHALVQVWGCVAMPMLGPPTKVWSISQPLLLFVYAHENMPRTKPSLYIGSTGVHEQIGINGLDNIGGKQEDILFLKLKSRKGLSLSSRGCLVTYRRILFTISTATDIYIQTRKNSKD